MYYYVAAVDFILRVSFAIVFFFLTNTDFVSYKIVHFEIATTDIFYKLRIFFLL